MGDYITGADVYSLLVNYQIGDSPRISEEDVDTMIEGYEAEINGILRAQGYTTVPATNSADRAMIREKLRRKVASQVYQALNQPTRAPDFCRTWDIDYAEWLTMLRKGQLRLSVQEPEVGDFQYVGVSLNLTELEDDDDA
jgi:hypothetical protein